jgi:histone H3
MPPHLKSDSLEEPASETVKATITKRKARRSFVIPRVTFRRLVEEIASDFKSDLRFQQDGLDALQESAEEMLSGRFQRCSQLAELCNRDTVRCEHWRFVQEGGGLPCSGMS